MLNKDNQRELAYVVVIDKITPIEGADRVALAHVGGWTVMVGKDEFEAGDPAVYFEIDSKVPETERFKFLEKKHYKIKTQKYFKGTVISQGLLMPAAAFNWKIESAQFAGGFSYLVDEDGNHHIPEDKDTMFLTKQLGVTYAVDDDNKRKGASVDKYKKMAARHPKLFQSPIIKKIYKTDLGKKILFVFFGKKRDSKSTFPTWVKKTDEERCQNMPYLFTDEDYQKKRWIATEKLDGTSTTFTLKRDEGWFKPKFDFRVCSRNVCFSKDEKKPCFYDTNVYTAMAEKYEAEEKLHILMDIFDEKFKEDDKRTVSFVTIQGETYGGSIQRREYSMDYNDFAAFNLIVGFTDGTTKRFNPIEMKDILSYKPIDIPCVPIVDMYFFLPKTCEELLKIAEGESRIDGGMREGLVFRDENGEMSFKAVSNPFLLRYHQ